MTKSEHFSESWEGWHFKKKSMSPKLQVSCLGCLSDLRCIALSDVFRVFRMKRLLKKNNHGDSRESLLGKKIGIELRLL